MDWRVGEVRVRGGNIYLRLCDTVHIHPDLWHPVGEMVFPSGKGRAETDAMFLAYYCLYSLSHSDQTLQLQ